MILVEPSIPLKWRSNWVLVSTTNSVVGTVMEAALAYLLTPLEILTSSI